MEDWPPQPKLKRRAGRPKLFGPSPILQVSVPAPLLSALDTWRGARSRQQAIRDLIDATCGEAENPLS